MIFLFSCFQYKRIIDNMTTAQRTDMAFMQVPQPTLIDIYDETLEEGKVEETKEETKEDEIQRRQMKDAERAKIEKKLNVCKYILPMVSIGFICPWLIYMLVYSSLINITYHNGVCTNIQNTVYIYTPETYSGIMYYNADIYDSINGTYIGSGNGGFGTAENSYKATSLTQSKDTDVYPYAKYIGNVPAWLCSYLPSGSKIWGKIYEMDDVDFYNTESLMSLSIWGDSEWIPCQYASLKHAKTGMTQKRIDGWLVVANTDETTYKPLNKTEQYITTIFFMYFFAGLVCVCAAYILTIQFLIYINNSCKTKT